MENFDELLKKANKGDPNAQCEIGKIYNNQGSYDKAIKYFKMAIDNGNMNAWYPLGCLHMNRKYEQNYSEAIKCLQVVSEDEDNVNKVDAQYFLGKLYLEKLNNKEEAIKWFKKAAEQKHGSAIKILEKLEKKEDIN